MKKLSLLILLLASSVQIALAINIEGIILDKETNLPIRDAVLLALSNNKVMASANSNAKGEFKITLKKGKMIHLEVVKNGYKTESADVEINQAFIEAAPFITIKLEPRTTSKDNSTANENTTGINMENIGKLSDLPDGYKIIEAVPIKEREQKKSGFNVREEVKDQTTNVNVDVLKTEYNKPLDTDVLDPNHNFTTSYYKDGAIYYNVAKAYLSNDVKEILKGIALRLKNDNETSLKLSAYSDADKELKIDEFICKMRIEEIVNLLMNEGVDFAQLDINIYGHQLLKNNCIEGSNCTEKQHQENRKVELTFLK